MANNRIPRNAKKIYITWKVDTTGNKAGDRATVEKTERGWILTTESGKRFYMPLALLRNADAVQVDHIETDEPNNRKDVLLSDIGTQVYIIDGASRTDKAAQAVIAALCNNGRITGELAERAKNDRPTLDKIKRNLLHVQMEERETETGMRWTFYTASGVYMDISAYSRNYIRADKQGNLYPTEAPTDPETSEAAQDTTCTDKEPQEGTETVQKTTDMATFCAAYRAAYTALYDHCGEPETDKKERYYCTLFDQEAEAIADIIRRFCVYRGDLLTSDREDAAFMIALETVGAPTDRETATDGETTTTSETKPQRATETPKKTADDTTTAGSDTDHTEATQEAPQTAGTSEGVETTTPPHKEPPRATDAATTGDGEQTTTAAAPTTSGDRSTDNKMTGSHAGPAKEMTAERSERRKRYLQRMINELARKRRKARRDAKEITTGRTTPPSAQKTTFSAWMQKSGSDPPKI